MWPDYRCDTHCDFLMNKLIRFSIYFILSTKEAFSDSIVWSKMLSQVRIYIIWPKLGKCFQGVYREQNVPRVTRWFLTIYTHTNLSGWLTGKNHITTLKAEILALHWTRDTMHFGATKMRRICYIVAGKSPLHATHGILQNNHWFSSCVIGCLTYSMRQEIYHNNEMSKKSYLRCWSDISNCLWIKLTILKIRFLYYKGVKVITVLIAFDKGLSSCCQVTKNCFSLKTTKIWLHKWN